jgi:hypothetical protein
MKFTKLMLTLATLGLGVMSAASSYNVKLYDSVWVGSTQLKAGEYKVEMVGDKAVFKTGKSVIEVPATMGTSDSKYNFTSLVSTDSKLHEIDLAGTKSKIMFSADAPSASGSK